MTSIQAVVVDADAPARLALRSVDAPSPDRGEALIQVKAISLNRGEVNRAQAAPEGTRIGWDFAGIVERAAASGAGPSVGSRVVGMLGTAAWAELIAAPATTLAVLPETVSFAQAATLPVAGLSALYALERGGVGIGRNVLITGATGGVGLFAIQLARLAGARVVALVRRPDQADQVRAAGAQEVAIGDRGDVAAEFGPFDTVVESVGGAVLGGAMELLAYGGVCVSLGASASAQVTFDARRFFPSGGRMYGFLLFNEITRYPMAADLGRLLTLVADGRLRTSIEVEDNWSNVGIVAEALRQRRYSGKAVLHVGS